LLLQNAARSVLMHQMDHLLDLGTSARQRIDLVGLQGSSQALIAALLAASNNLPLLYITPSERLAELAVQDISLFSRVPAILYPGFDIPPYTPLSPDQHCSGESYLKAFSGLWQN
jgi:transcription-repair coupling factor (superfamily II helicase)